MKKMMIITAIAAIALTTTVMAAPAEARWGWGGGSPGVGYYCSDAVTARVNLTAEQATKLNALRDAHFKEIKPLQDRLYSKSGDLRILWLQSTPDRLKILNTQKEIRTIRDQLYDKQTAHQLEARKVLTPDQQSLLGNYGPGPGPGYGPYGAGMGYGRGHRVRMGY